MDTNTVAQTEHSSQHLPTRLYAWPYGTNVTGADGFCFSTIEEFTAQASQLPASIDKFSFHFNSGEDIDATLHKIFKESIDQSNIGEFLEMINTWSECEKKRAIFLAIAHNQRFDSIVYEYAVAPASYEGEGTGVSYFYDYEDLPPHALIIHDVLSKYI